MIAVAQDLAVQGRRRDPFGAEPGHAGADPVVPGGGGLVAALPAGDDQALPGPGQRDVQEPAVLLLLRLQRALIGGPAYGVLEIARDPPQRQAAVPRPQ